MAVPIQSGARQQVAPNIKQQHKDARQPISRVVQIVLADLQAVQEGRRPIARTLFTQANDQ